MDRRGGVRGGRDGLDPVEHRANCAYIFSCVPRMEGVFRRIIDALRSGDPGSAGTAAENTNEVLLIP